MYSPLPSPSLPSYTSPYLYHARSELIRTISASSSSPPTSPSPQSPHRSHRHTRPRSSSADDYFGQQHRIIKTVPNLELHSAAAEGNVGLVHYALTHGQPVNSVLHGVQPIHAAAAGGSVSALKMLIDRGADVNAPRLPRRYSNEKKRGAPSLGAAGATPLHFAAANGHGQIVQILLACGANPDKADKLGQTAESLAEANGHPEVLRVLQVYDHLKRQGSDINEETSSIHSGIDCREEHSEIQAGPSFTSLTQSPSRSMSNLGVDDDSYSRVSVSSRKGKERAESIASQASDASGLVRMRKSLEGLFGRRSRKGSMTMTGIESPPPPPVPPTPPRIEIDGEDPPVDHLQEQEEEIKKGLEGLSFEEGLAMGPENPIEVTNQYAHPALTDEATSPSAVELPEMDLDTPLAEQNTDPMREIGNPELKVPAPSVMSDLTQNTITAPSPGLESDSMPSLQQTLQNESPQLPRPEIGRSSISLPVILPSSQSSTPIDPSRLSPTPQHPSAMASAPELADDLSRTTSRSSFVSAAEMIDSIRPISPVLPLPRSNNTPPAPHRMSFSSRRPSLPSILEKAVHPGQAFRNALRRDQNDQAVRFSPETSPIERDHPRSASGGSFFGRGRLRSNDSSLSSASSTGSHTLQGAQEKARKYMSRGALIGLFRRSNSPPSRSPSPPSSRSNPVDAQELEDGIERLRKASIEMDKLSEEGDYDGDREYPKSAPVTKTRFFEDLSNTTPTIPTSAFLAYNPRSPELTPSGNANVGGGTRKGNRPRKTSEVIAPSPLANEYIRESSDSDNPGSANIRRNKTDAGQPPSKLNQIVTTGGGSGGGGGGADRKRSATLPSSGSKGPIGTARIANLWDEDADLRSGVLRRESEKMREEVEMLADEIEQEDNEEVEKMKKEEAVAEEKDTQEIEQSEDPGRTTPIPQTTSPEGGRDDLLLSPPESITSGYFKPATKRFRGASIGSMNSQSSRISTGTKSSVRFSTPSDDGNSEKHMSRARLYSDSKYIPPPPPTSVGGTVETRPRGVSVSSIATTNSSGLNFSYNQSTPATSLTPPSTISIVLGGFAPVPEESDGRHPPRPQRRFSSREEAVKAVKQQEDDVLQLAQLPMNANSSRDLAAQLAAYGESHAMAQELVERERYERRQRRKSSGAQSHGAAPGGAGGVNFEFGGDDSEVTSQSSSFVSARSTPSQLESVGSSGRHSGTASESHRRNSKGEVIPPVPNISSIYDRRAAKYREKMQALTSTKSRRSSSKDGGASIRETRAITEIRNPMIGPPAWLTSAGGHDNRPLGRPAEIISSSIPVGSLPVQPPGQGIMAGANAPKHRTRQHSGPPHHHPHPPHPHPVSAGSVTRVTSHDTQSSTRSPTSNTIPPPIADIVNTRYKGMISPNSQATFNINTPRSVSTPLQSTTARQRPHGHHRHHPHQHQHPHAQDPIQPSTSLPTTNMPSSHPPPQVPGSVSGGSHGGGPHSHHTHPAPPVSIFSHKYAGPHDGGDSDDSEHEATGYTVIENNWRGGRIVGPEDVDEGFGKKNKWGGIKGFAKRGK